MMSDDVAPYSGAIEESAKATSKALDLVNDAAPAIADIYGILIGDRVQAARHRRLDEITRKTKKILRDRDQSETAEVPEQIAIPLLEAAQREPREEMQDLWAQLLANAMDPTRKGDVRPEFVSILRQFEPIDASVLLEISKRPNDFHGAIHLSEKLGIRASTVSVSLASLISLGCIKKSSNDESCKLAPLGAEIIFACRSH